ncbi:uncharacterized protein LOC126702589 [Quercus robur]|uniref:uncharacterized protein LOC126702589 n=1 Tax=Quercus robur TaxID=38942 RepID=UPI0021632E32|nr:uncharacterized protein LOC126702589 [Quercus robur]
MEVSDLVSCTEKISCQDIKLELTPNQNMNPTPELTLLAKLYTTKTISFIMVKEVTQKAWKPAFPMEVKKLSQNIYMLSFSHEVDFHKVYHKCPWSIRGGHLVLKKWSLDLSWQEVDFSLSTIWIQIHGLPDLWRTEDNLKRIGSKISSVVNVDLIGDFGGTWKKFIQVRVEVDISNRLLPGVLLPRQGRSDLWISLKYEKIADLYYQCDIIGHDKNHCLAEPFRLYNSSGKPFKATSPWLRADNDDIPPKA